MDNVIEATTVSEKKFTLPNGKEELVQYQVSDTSKHFLQRIVILESNNVWHTEWYRSYEYPQAIASRKCEHVLFTAFSDFWLGTFPTNKPVMICY